MYRQGVVPSLVRPAAHGPEFDFTTFPEVVKAARDAYARQESMTPARSGRLAEVHDCSPDRNRPHGGSRLLRGRPRVEDVLGGDFDATDGWPIKSRWGLKSFGHPVGASGLRMLYEA